MSRPLERLVIRGIRALDPSQGLDAVVDIVVEQGVIRACEVGAGQAFPTFPELDGQALIAMPGLTDLRARLGEPGFEYKEDLCSGLSSAAAGGFTAVCALPETQPVHDDAVITRALLAGAAHVGAATLLPVAAATRGLLGQQLSNIGELQAAGAVALSDGDHYIASANVMRRVLEYSNSFDLLVMQHPREASLSAHAVFHEGATSSRLGLTGWPRVAESLALSRDLELLAATGARLHAATLSAQTSLPLVERAKSRGLRISADVAIHHLLLDETAISDFDTRFRVEPPLRESSDKEALIDALASGVLDCVVSDHRPQTTLDRNCEFPEAEPGFAGLQLVLPGLWSLVHAGRLKALRAVECLSTRPAQLLGKAAPSLRAGQLATFTLFAPEQRWVPSGGSWLSKSVNTPLFAAELRGQVILTALAGSVIYQSEERT